jgi:hypothetical protein
MISKSKTTKTTNNESFIFIIVYLHYIYDFHKFKSQKSPIFCIFHQYIYLLQKRLQTSKYSGNHLKIRSA